MSHGKRFSVQLHGCVRTSEQEIEMTIWPDLGAWEMDLEGKSIADVSAFVASIVCRAIPHFLVHEVTIHVECKTCGSHFDSDTNAPACNCDG